MKLLIALSILLYACQSQHTPDKQQAAETPIPTQIQPRDTIICPDDIERSADSIPPNLFSPKQRENICGGWIPEDTVTAGGNYIKYLITNDTCCRDNLYIAWGNKYMERTEVITSLRAFHAKMIPDFLAETKEAIYLSGAASGGLPVIGWLLWRFPLDATDEIDSYFMPSYEGCFDPESLTLIRIRQDRMDDQHEFLEAYNIRTKKTKRIRFQNFQKAPELCMAIDSCAVSATRIFIRVQLYDRRNNPVEEILLLKNDIW